MNHQSVDYKQGELTLLDIFYALKKMNAKIKHTFAQLLLLILDKKKIFLTVFFTSLFFSVSHFFFLPQTYTYSQMLNLNYDSNDYIHNAKNAKIEINHVIIPELYTSSKLSSVAKQLLLHDIRLKAQNNKNFLLIKARGVAENEVFYKLIFAELLRGFNRHKSDDEIEEKQLLQNKLALLEQQDAWLHKAIKKQEESWLVSAKKITTKAQNSNLRNESFSEQIYAETELHNILIENKLLLKIHNERDKTKLALKKYNPGEYSSNFSIVPYKLNPLYLYTLVTIACFVITLLVIFIINFISNLSAHVNKSIS